jgi:hypothetical protein
MTTSTKRLQAVATLSLSHVGDDIRDIDIEIMAVNKELEMLTAKMSDAMWEGRSDTLNGVLYQIMLKRTMRTILHKRRKVKLRETKE